MSQRLIALALCFAVALPAAADVRDPMRPPVNAIAHAGISRDEPVVTAVFIAAERRAAIVDGHLVHRGDTVRGFAIEAVLDDGIRYRRAGSVRELHLRHSELQMKKPAARAPAASGVN
jgi:hypothetical protein